MPKATFIATDSTLWPVELRNGYALMEGAREAGVPGILANCGGACACATCHVHIPPAWRDAVGPPLPGEAEMLMFANQVTDASRLSCQIVMRPELDGLVLEVVEEG